MGREEVRLKLREILRVMKEFDESVKSGNPGKGVSPSDILETSPPEKDLVTYEDKKSNSLICQDPRMNGYYGACPYCKKNDGYLNRGWHPWFICDTHRVKWNFGECIFSTTNLENCEEQKAVSVLLDSYVTVEPLWLGPIND